MALVAHLGHDLVLFGGLRQRSGLIDVVREGLFAERVLAILDGPHGGRGVVVVGRGDEDYVDLLVHLVEHLAVVEEGLDLVHLDFLFAQPLHGVGHAGIIHIHEGDKLLAHGRAHAGPALAVSANDSGAELARGGRMDEWPLHDARTNQRPADDCALAKDAATTDLPAHGSPCGRVRKTATPVNGLYCRGEQWLTWIRRVADGISPEGKRFCNWRVHAIETSMGREMPQSGQIRL